MEWIKVSDQEPELYEEVIFIVESRDKSYNGRRMGGRYQGKRRDWYEFSTPGMGFSATLWQPMPPLPHHF